MSDSEGNWSHDMQNDEGNINAFSLEPTPSINSQGTLSSKSTKRKVTMMEMLETQYRKLNSGIERVSEVPERVNAIAERSLAILESGRPHYYKEEEIYSELELIGIYPDVVMNAYCYLSNNPATIRAFFGLPRARRLEWLMRSMGNM